MMMSRELFWRQVHSPPCKQKEGIGEEKQKAVVAAAITSIGNHCLTIVVPDVGWLL